MEEERGSGWHQGIHPDDRELCLQTCRNAFHSKIPFEREYRLMHHSGEYRWILDHGRPQYDDEGTFTGYIGVCFDLSERKQSEESIRRNENRFKEFADLLPQTVFEMDRTATITFANRESFTMFGFTQEDFTKGLKATDVLIPAERERAVRDIGNVLNGSIPQGAEYTGLRRDGTTFPIIIYSHPIVHGSIVEGLRGIIVDISQRKLIEEKLRLQTTALQTAANAIVMTNRSGEVLWANDAFTQLTGYGINEVLGKKTSVLRSGKHGLEFYRNLWETILSGKVWRHEVINRRKDGTLYIEDMTITPVPNDNGEITHFIAIKQDITEQNALREQLFQAQKMESLGTLAGGIAHDFNNLLGIILVYSNLLEESPHDAKVFTESLAAINRAVSRGKDITGQVLTFAHKTDLNFEPIDLSGLVHEFINMAANTFPKTISFIGDVRRCDPILADPSRLHQILLNLCLNAKDTMENSGTITIRTGMTAGDHLRQKHVEAKHHTYAFVSVGDTGKGMNEYLAKRIWEPFFTTKEKGKGTGLGLSVVYGITQQHNGIVDVETAEGRGATFSIYLPVVTAALHKKGDNIASGRSVKVNEGTECILFVEDEQLLTVRIKPYFQKRGYTVLIAEDGEEALRIYAGNRESIDIVVTDIGLPKISGIELFGRIRDMDPKAKIVLASGFFDPGFVSGLSEADSSALIHKPYVPSKLLNLVRTVLDAG